MKTKDYILGILDALLVLVAIFIAILTIPLILGEFNSNTEVNDIQDVIDSCSGMSLVDASTCATDMTSEFYKYNIDNMSKDLDFQTLKKEGGVCTSWSDYYNEIGEGLGYNTEGVIVKVSDNFYHQFSVWSNEDNYCILDQTAVSCFGF
jgi:hypothetical protein